MMPLSGTGLRGRATSPALLEIVIRPGMKAWDVGGGGAAGIVWIGVSNAARKTRETKPDDDARHCTAVESFAASVDVAAPAGRDVSDGAMTPTVCGVPLRAIANSTAQLVALASRRAALVFSTAFAGC